MKGRPLRTHARVKTSGKMISGVIFKRSGRSSPSGQVFLLFPDNTYYEFYCCGDYSRLHAAGGLNQGNAEDVRQYMSDSMEIVFDKSIETLGRNTERQK